MTLFPRSSNVDDDKIWRLYHNIYRIFKVVIWLKTTKIVVVANAQIWRGLIYHHFRALTTTTFLAILSLKTTLNILFL